MPVRGLRGATTASANERAAILEATRELLLALAEENSLVTSEIASALFTTTSDLDTAFPATAARQIGWTEVPLLGCRESDVGDGVPLCVRVLLHVNTELPQSAMRHVYLRGATGLREKVARVADS